MSLRSTARRVKPIEYAGNGDGCAAANYETALFVSHEAVIANSTFRNIAGAAVTAWQGHRSSRLTIHYRVIYRVDRKGVTVNVERVSNHDYRA